MKPRVRAKASSGAVLIFAMLLLVAGAMVLGGVAQLAATRALVGEQEWSGLARRVRLANSRALARQFLLSRMYAGFLPAAGLTNQFGGFQVSSPPLATFWRSSPETNTTVSLDPFSLLGSGGALVVFVNAGLWDGTNSLGWSFRVRMRSPIAAGYAFVRQKPSPPGFAPGIPAYIDMQTSSDAFWGFPGLPSVPVSSSSGTNALETDGYRGYLGTEVAEANVPSGTNVSSGFYGEEFTSVSYAPLVPNVSMQAIVDLASFTNPVAGRVFQCSILNKAPYTYVSGGSNVTVYRDVKSVVLGGTTSGDSADPVLVRIQQVNTNVTQLVLSNQNNRRVYVSRVQGGVLGDPPVPSLIVGSTNTGLNAWRVGITYAMGKNITTNRVLFESGMVAMKGGLRTDAEVIGSPSVEPETNPQGLERIGDRMMWLEDHRFVQ